MSEKFLQDPARGTIDSFNTSSIRIDTLKGIKPLKATVPFRFPGIQLQGHDVPFKIILHLIGPGPPWLGQFSAAPLFAFDGT